MNTRYPRATGIEACAWAMPAGRTDRPVPADAVAAGTEPVAAMMRRWAGAGVAAAAPVLAAAMGAATSFMITFRAHL